MLINWWSDRNIHRKSWTCIHEIRILSEIFDKIINAPLDKKKDVLATYKIYTLKTPFKRNIGKDLHSFTRDLIDMEKKGINPRQAPEVQNMKMQAIDAFEKNGLP